MIEKIVISVGILVFLFWLLWQSALAADEAPRPQDVPEDIQ